MLNVAVAWFTKPYKVIVTGLLAPVCSVKSISARYVAFAAAAVAAVDIEVGAVAVCENASQFEVPAAA